MVCLRICAILALSLVSAQAVTPMEKVLTLLGDLKTDIEKEGKAEAGTYEKFACFCKDATTKKSKSITDGQDKIDTTNADIGSKTATKKEKITKHGKEQQTVEDTTKKLEETTEVYQKDKATYEATNADLTKAVNSAKRAHKALSESKGASFIDLGTKSDVQNCLDLAAALGMGQASDHEELKRKARSEIRSERDAAIKAEEDLTLKQAASSFLQVDPSDPAFKFHSDKILTIISDLQKDFQTEKDSVNEEWQKTDKAYKAEKKDLEAKIKTAKDEIKKLNGEIDKLKADIAKLKEDLVSAEANLQDDSTYLRDLTDRCQEKAEAWDQRTKTRKGEVDVLTKALKILNEKAKDADKAVNKRALLIHVNKPAAPTAKVAVKTPVKAAKTTVEVKKAVPEVKAAKAAVTVKKVVSFLQAASSSSRAQERAIAVLREESVRLNSNVLSSVAAQIMADPFIKIKKLIQGLIERLLEESKNEATKKGFCDTEMGKSEKTRDMRFADINKLDTEVEELEAHQKKLELEIKELTAELKDLDEELKKATKLRGEEKTDNAETVKKATDGAKAVGEALTILKDFYKSAAKETNLLQASPVDEDSPGAGFDDAYKGDQSSSKGILGLLEVIKSDFERTVRKTEAEEAKAHEEFINFDRSSKSDIGAKTTKKLLDEQDLESTKSGIDESMKDLKTATKLLDGALKNLEELKPTCVDTGMSYAERVQKREEEIKALGKALCALDEDKVESECQ